MTVQDRSRLLRRRGAIILALFALLWGAVAASGFDAATGWVVRIAAVVIALGIVGYALRPAVVPERELVVGPSQEVSRIVIGLIAAATLWGTAAGLAVRG